VKIHIEIDTIQELLELSEHLSRMVFIPVEAPEPEPEVEQPKVRKTRAKAAAEPADEPKPEAPAEAAPQPEPEPATAPEGKAEEPPKEKPAKAKKVTRDDVVQAFRGYIDRFGQKAAMTDVTVLLKRGFDVSMIKEFPDGEENFRKAIKIVTEAININEFNREAVQ